MHNFLNSSGLGLRGIQLPRFHEALLDYEFVLCIYMEIWTVSENFKRLLNNFACIRSTGRLEQILSILSFGSTYSLMDSSRRLPMDTKWNYYVIFGLLDWAQFISSCLGCPHACYASKEIVTLFHDQPILG